MRHDRRTILPVALALGAGFVAGLALGLSTDEIAVGYYTRALKRNPGAWWEFAEARDGTGKRAAFERFAGRSEGAALIRDVLSPRGPYASVDPWFHPPRLETAFSLIDSEISAVWEVPKSRFPYAEDLLNETACVPLTSEEAELAFDLRNVELPEASRLFIVRSVYLVPAQGFSVYFEGGDLLVSQGVLGRTAAPMERTALFVALPYPPGETFVYCSMAE